MYIYQKVDEHLVGLEALKNYVEESKGIELQFFHNDGIWGNYEITPAVENLMKEVPTIQEITIHPPLANYDIELVSFKDINLIKDRIKESINLSNKYNIKINLLYHASWPIKMMEQGPIERIEELVKMLQDTNVNMLLENLCSREGFEDPCPVLEICRRIDNEHLKMCLDICHLHCVANKFRINLNNFLDVYLDKTLAEKYIYQIHFSATKNNDGFIDKKKTHGRKHDSLEELKPDYKILEDYNLTQKKIITEVSEEDYVSRKDQKYEIELLKKM